MITQIGTTAVYVSDQKAAEEFWTQQVGFEVAARKEMGPGAFWLEVRPKGAQSALVLYPRAAMKEWEEMKPSIVFQCDNFDERPMSSSGPTGKGRRADEPSLGQVPPVRGSGR